MSTLGATPDQSSLLNDVCVGVWYSLQGEGNPSSITWKDMNTHGLTKECSKFLHGKVHGE